MTDGMEIRFLHPFLCPSDHAHSIQILNVRAQIFPAPGSCPELHYNECDRAIIAREALKNGEFTGVLRSVGLAGHRSSCRGGVRMDRPGIRVVAQDLISAIGADGRSLLVKILVQGDVVGLVPIDVVLLCLVAGFAGIAGSLF